MDTMQWNAPDVLSHLNQAERMIQVSAESFTNINMPAIYADYQDLFRDRIAGVVSVLRDTESKDRFEEGTIDEAINSLSRFVSLMGDSLDKYREVIQFDADLTDSIEITFKGQKVTRLNLMFTELNKAEEAFLFYMRDGRPTQVNGSLPLMVELLKQILE